MTTFEPAYRAAVYKTKRQAATGSLIMESRDSSEKFLVTTLPAFSDVTGSWKPYLEQVRGRRGAINPLSKQIDTGRLDLQMYDVRTTPGGSNAQRWLTQFFGDDEYLMQLAGCKVYVEESIDNGATWNPYFTGRIINPTLNSKIKHTITARDLSDDFKSVPVFSGPPHSSVSYAKPAYLVPPGLPVEYGGVQPRPALRGNPLIGPPYSIHGYMKEIRVNTDYDGYMTTDDLMTEWFPGFNDTGIGYAVPANDQLIAEVTMLTGPNSGSSAHYKFGGAYGVPDPNAVALKTLPRLERIYVGELNPSDPNYGSLDLLDVYYQCEFRVFYRPTTQQQILTPLEKPIPIVVSNVDARTLLADLLDGYFGSFYDTTIALPTGSNYGDPLYPFTYNSQSIADLNYYPYLDHLDDRVIGGTEDYIRGIIDKPDTLFEWIKKNILDPFNWIMWFDESGVINVAELSSDPEADQTIVATITNADLVAGHSYQQMFDANNAITSISETYIQDVYYPNFVAENQITNKDIEELGPTLIQTSEWKRNRINARALDFGTRSKEIESALMRFWRSESDPEYQFIAGLVGQEADSLLDIYQAGPMYHSLTLARTATTENVKLGKYVRLQIDEMVNPYTNERGGSRIGLVTERTENGLTVNVKVLDIVAEIISAAPHPGTIQVASDDVRHSVEIADFSSSADANVFLEVGITDQTVGTRPSDSGSWSRSQRVYTHGGHPTSYAFRQLPSGKRIWGKLRAKDLGNNPPSDWVYPTNNYVDLPTLPTPGVITTSGITGGTCTLTWTNPADAEYGIVELKLDGATSASAQVERVTLLDSLTTEYELVGLITSSDYTVALRYIDQGELGGTGPFRVKEFTTSGSYAQCPRPAEFIAL